MLWNIIIGLGLMILGYVLMPKPKLDKPDEVTEMDSPTSEAGKPITVIFGDITVTSPNFLWWGDKKFYERNVRGGKKSS
ncbi:hypothetical protein [Neoaquamicrobium sediminum]|uniref:hypothetical protein n=1 Tax=Neoaquamicrobium sediminum TaxID=1849104 RepID=UPI0015661B0D|nr:hypothetical protein [Mesorhizobium sediminum]NRC54132.1 hypothetical protein [Mesorhizobium sediminum]